MLRALLHRTALRPGQRVHVTLRFEGRISVLFVRVRTRFPIEHVQYRRDRRHKFSDAQASWIRPLLLRGWSLAQPAIPKERFASAQAARLSASRCSALFGVPFPFFPLKLDSLLSHVRTALF